LPVSRFSIILINRSKTKHRGETMPEQPRDRETPLRTAAGVLDDRSDAFHGGVTRALVVSDVRLYREALAWRLSQPGRVKVVGTAQDAAIALEQLSALAPDVVVVDRAMPDALSTAKSIAELSCAKVVAFAIADMDQAVIECAEAGLAGYVTRDGSVEDLVDAVERAMRGEVLCSPRVAATLFRRLAALSAAAPATAPRETELTQREREIGLLIERGLSNKEIARHLSIGTATVKNHVHHILEKLDVRRRGEAAASLRDAGTSRRTNGKREERHLI
jgi:two-component system nitrate/nitrite response regulator NarL